MAPSDPLQRLTPVENCALGIASGAIEVCVNQPILYWKNASQQGMGFSLNPRLLYRGLGMSVTNMAVLTGLQFPLAGMVTHAITGGVNRRLTGSEATAAGFVGGFLSGIACAPMELVMIQQQKFGGSALTTPLRIVRAHGLAGGLMRGLTTACGREGLYTAGYLGLAPTLATYLIEQHGVAPTQAALLGAIPAGLVAATLSHPLDTIKTCMQGDLERKTFGSFTQTAATLYADGGVGRFLRGWGWRTGRMISGMFIMNEARRVLAPLMFPSIMIEPTPSTQ